jgi:hypothetical protein
MAREAVDLGNHARLSSPETFPKPRQFGTAIAATRRDFGGAAHLAPRGAQRMFLRGEILLVVATNTYLQNAMDMLLSRKSLDLGTVADQSALNNPLETPKLSHPHVL